MPAPQPRTNDLGFPIVCCYRCKGSGTFSYNPQTGTTCFGCGGSGWSIRRGKAAKAWGAYQEAVKAAEEKPWAEVAEGEAVRPFWERPNKVVKVRSIREDPNNPGGVVVRLSNGSLIGTSPEFRVKVAEVDPARLPDPGEYTRGL